MCQLENVGSTNPPKLSKLRPLALATDYVSQLYVRDHWPPNSNLNIIKFEISDMGLGGVVLSLFPRMCRAFYLDTHLTRVLIC